MKKLLLIATLLFAVSSVYAAAEVKEACLKNEKTGKEVCKKIKVHKKVEGEKVPDGKK